MRAGSPRSVFVVVALGLTLGLAALLAVLAQTSATYQRATAEGVLRDYAAFAAEQYAGRLQQRLATAGFPVLSALSQAGAGREHGSLPDPVTLRLSASVQGQGLLRSGPTLFRLVLSDGSVTMNPVPADRSITRWVRDTIGTHAKTVYRTDWYLALVWGGSSQQHLAAIYTVARDSGGPGGIAYGLLVHRDTLARLFRQTAEGAPLLPASLTGGVVVDSVAGVRVLAADSTEIFATQPRYISPFRATRMLDAIFGGTSTEVVLRPAIAPKLLIGGVPGSRLPLVLGLLGLTGVLVITAIMQLRREQELARLRGDFVSSVSHELRTPLAQIRMFTETLLLGRVRSDQERRRSLEILDQESRRLTHLVDNLLHVARGEAPGRRLRPEPVDLGVVVRDAVEGFTPLAAARRVTLETRIAPGVTARVDREALQQVLLNLLDNAVKYGPLGGVVTVSVDAIEGTGRLTVSDRGPGVPTHERDRIWERFARLDRDVDSAVAGSGIGLAIVRELVMSHGGSCRVEDAPGGGASFVVELPA